MPSIATSGGWKFEDVSKQAGVDLAAWGSGACAGDFDGDGRLDLYVTNWGPNALFRNRGDGTFEDVAAQRRRRRRRLEHGLHVLRRRRRRRSRPLRRALRRDDVGFRRRARSGRSLWRNGPHIMVGPAGLPGESDLFFENVGNGRFVEATDAHGLSDTVPRLRLRRRGDRLRRRRVRRSVRRERLEPEFPVSQPRERPLRKRRLDRRRGA